MARTVLSLALLACLGLAFLHLVSAEQQNQEIEEKATDANSAEYQIRISREADAEAKGKRGARKRNKKDGQKCKKGKEGKDCRQKKKIKGRNFTKKCSKGKDGRKCRKKNRNGGRKSGQNGKKSKRGRSMKRRKSGKRGKPGKRGRSKEKCKGDNCKNKNGEKRKKDQHNKTGQGKKGEERQAACDTEALCQKIKDYIKYSNQLRKLRRINKTCSTMEKKRDKAGGGEFSASGEANDASDNSTVQDIADKLKNCTSTAKAKCETKAIPACTNLTLNNKCEAELDAWIKKFGPAKGSCLQASASCCACITGISPAPSADCLNFDPLDIASKAKKKKCTGSSEEGSFGHCRKLQMEAAEKGPKAHKEKCKGKGDMTTAKSSGRRNIFRSNLMKKFIKT